MLTLKNSRTTSLGNGRFALDCFIGAVQMSEDGQAWQDIKPYLVRDTSGWHIDGAPYYAEFKDDGTRLFCPDRNERSKYFRLPAIPLFTGLTRNVLSSPTKLDGQLLPDRIVMPVEWGEIRIIFTNTGMKFEVLFAEAPPEQLNGKFTFDVDLAGLDILTLLSAKQGVGIPRPRLVDSKEEPEQRPLDWSYKDGQLELGFDLTGLKFPVILKNTTLEVQVGAGTDDAYESDSGSVPTNDWIRIYTAPAATYPRKSGGMKFNGVTVPQGTVPSVAYYQGYPSISGLNNIHCTIHLNDVDNANDFSTEADVEDRAKTSGVDWEEDSLTLNQYHSSPSIVTPCTELFGRGGWSSGNSLAILEIAKTSGGYCIWSDVDNDSSNAPKLHIEYTAGGGGVDVSPAAVSGVGGRDNPTVSLDSGSAPFAGAVYAVMYELTFDNESDANTMQSNINSWLTGKSQWGTTRNIVSDNSNILEARLINQADMDELFGYVEKRMTEIPVVSGRVHKHFCSHKNNSHPCEIILETEV